MSGGARAKTLAETFRQQKLNIEINVFFTTLKLSFAQIYISVIFLKISGLQPLWRLNCIKVGYSALQ